MPPSAKTLEQALLDGTCDVYKADPDNTTVNKVRSHVEEKLKLEDDFFSNGTWKSKSKSIIKQRVEALLDGWEPELKDESKSKNGTKRRTSESASPEVKRVKRGSSKPKKPAKQEESDLTELSEEEEEEEVEEEEEEEKKPRKEKKSGSQAAAVNQEESSELSDLSDLSEEEKPQKKKAAGKRKAKAEDSDEDDMSSKAKSGLPGTTLKDEGSSDGDKVKTQDSEEKVSTKKDDEPPQVVVDEEEYSDVIDEPPQPKRKKKEKTKAAASKPVKVTKASAKKAALPDDPNEVEMKKLQSQLSKCGVRKIWPFELKQYGDDVKAKIRHLRKMLSDIGMEGRFSEAKAREIKETRELAAEAEAALEMNRLWGIDTGGRANRSRGRNAKGENKPIAAKEDSDDSGDGGGAGEDDDEEKEDNTYAARRKRAHAELAFLGDDSDSD